MLEQGFSKVHKDADDHSDTLATRGRNAFDFAALAEVCGNRQDAYAKCMLALVQKNIPFFKEHRRLREAMGKIQNSSGPGGLAHIACSAAYPRRV